MAKQTSAGLPALHNPSPEKKAKIEATASESVPASSSVGSTGSGRYTATMDTLRETLQTYGVAVLPSVLNATECTAMVAGMWDYLETVSRDFKPLSDGTPGQPIHRDHKDTWKSLQQLYPRQRILQQFGIGHAQMSWDLRQNPKVIAPFSEIWRTKASQLLTSFTGASFVMPPEITGYGWDDGRADWHTDQSYTRNGFECIQSWVTAFDVSEGDATLAVLEGSHKFHGAFRQAMKQKKTDTDSNVVDFKRPSVVSKVESKDDWFKLNDEHVAWYKQHGCIPAYIACPAGSMVLWDSRTIHYGRAPTKGRVSQDHLRCVSFVCMTPRSSCSSANLKKRIQAFESMRTTSHWPHTPKLNPTAPRIWGRQLPSMNSIPKPQLNAIGRRLVGYDK